MTSFSGDILFSQQPAPKLPWRSLAASYVIQGAAVALLLTVSLATPHIVQKHYQQIELVQPQELLRPRVVVHRTPSRPVIVLPQRARKLLQMTHPPELVAPIIKVPTPVLPHPEVARAPQPKYVPQAQQAFEMNPAAKAVPRTAQVKTNVFGSSAEPTLKNKGISQVQTGGFGSPAGFKPNPNSAARRANVATTGAFDLPSGPGRGNGSGGSRGTPGTVASAGFGSGVAVPPTGHGPQGRIQSTPFNAVAAAPATPRTHVINSGPVSTPVAVQSKPKPVYTSEARELRIQGEVLLEVNFSAKGQVHVIRVVRGLGHGLDEAATRAAQGIRFTPAERDGHSVDSIATLHIIFQLS